MMHFCPTVLPFMHCIFKQISGRFADMAELVGYRVTHF